MSNNATRRETRQEARESVELPRNASIVLEVYRTAYPEGKTADEVAELLRWEVTSVRPRVTQLAAAKLIEETGEKRPTRSGRSAAVMRWRSSQGRLF